MPFQRGEGRTVVYEWDLEEQDVAYGDVFEHNFADRLADLKDIPEQRYRNGNEAGIFLWLVLVRYEGTTFYGEADFDGFFTHAYLNDDGTFPEYFQDGAKVPKRMHKEFERNSEWASQYTNKGTPLSVRWGQT
tara:strand:+ start:296 stop:694 length:399 start_codon:yes stop_codon:yes gene_type:complete